MFLAGLLAVQEGSRRGCAPSSRRLRPAAEPSRPSRLALSPSHPAPECEADVMFSCCWRIFEKGSVSFKMCFYLDLIL